MKQRHVIESLIVVVTLLALIFVYASMRRVRSESQRKAILGNLREISSSSWQYMHDHGATQASYHDIVGSGSDHYVRQVNSVAGEDYTGIIIKNTTTQISAQTTDGMSVFFNL